MSAKNRLQKEIIPETVKVIRASSGLKAQDIGFHKTLEPQLATEANRTSDRLIGVANDLILSISNDNEELIVDNDDEFQGSNWKKLSDTLDTLFERADVLFDEVNNGDSANNHTAKFTYLESSNNVTKDESKNLGKKMEKPQLKFKFPVDNMESGPFKPKLNSKPNSLIPLEKSVRLIQPGKPTESDMTIIDPPFYPHPYQHEIDNQPYPNDTIHEGPVIPFKPFETTTATWIDKPEQIDELIEELSSLSEIAIDLEHHDYRTYYGLVCLMQISNRDKDWIIDTLALRDDLQKLNIIFTDPNVVKVFHGAFMDIIWLQRDLGLYIVSLFDTYHASRKLGFPKFSLAYLLETFAHFKTSKKYQLADWRIRPLLQPMLAYARSDTHFLLNIYDQLRNKLVKANNNKIQEVLYESRQVAKRRFEFTKFRPLTAKGSNLVTCPVMASNPNEPYLAIVTQFNIPFHIRPVVAVLYDWRDRLAKDLDESVRYVMPNQALALLATLSKPIDAKKILSIPTLISGPMRDHSQDLADIINTTLSKLEENDWELTYKANNDTEVLKKETALTPETVTLENQLLAQIYKENIGLLGDSKNEKLEKASIIFNKPSTNYFGISFQGHVNKRVLLDELQRREIKVTEEFKKFNQADSLAAEADLSKELYNEGPLETDDQEEQSKEEQPKEEQPKEDQPKEEELKDDIISLRKPKKSRSQKRAYNQNDDVPFDYSKVKNLMQSKPTDEHNKRKKTFNPYSETGSGPKPARHRKNIHGGKSGTFKK